MDKDKLYSAIEHAIITWTLDGTGTAGSLTREIVSLIERHEQPALSHWVKFDFYDLNTRPTKYDKYLVCRKDGKIHWEIWNTSGWAYNHNSITHWAVIESPKQQQDEEQTND